MKILLVCTGNTCRSPLAEVLLRRALTEAGVADAQVSSAGTGAMEGAPASEGSYLVALENGLDLAAHRSRAVTRAMLAETDLALTMSRSHLRKLEQLGASDRSHLLGEYAGATGELEVADPVSGPIEEYRSTYHEIEAMTLAVARRIAQEVKGDRR